MGKKLATGVVALVALVMLVPATAWAQGTSGTIRGKVSDRSTNESLAAVNVFVLEADGTVTAMGAFTNAEGEYVIINVPPGRYTLRATMMGYITYEYELMLVTVGVSTTMNFELESTVLDVGEVVTVTAERDMIQRDVTGSQQTYTIEEMERMAVTSTTDILSLQTNAITLADNFMDDIPGYQDRGLEQVHMRGGRNSEVAFMVDGMQITNLVFGGQAAQVSPFSLSEMVVMAGGMSAEFGNAMSGVVNMVTRQGGSRYDANVEVLSSEFSGQEGDDVLNTTRLQGYLGGPIPLIPKLTFFLSGSGNHGRTNAMVRDDIAFDYEANPNDPNWEFDPNITYRDMPYTAEGNFDRDAYDPAIHSPYDQRGPNDRNIWGGDIYSGWVGLGYDNRWDLMLNMTYKLTPRMKLNLSGQLNGRWSVPYTWQWRHAMMWGWDPAVQDYWIIGHPEYDQYDQWGNMVDDPGNNAPRIGSSGNLDFQNEKNELVNDNQRLSFIWTHQIDQATFYSLRGAYYDYNRTMRVNRDVSDDGWIWKEEHIWRGIENDPTDPTYNQPVVPNWTPYDPMHNVELKWIYGGYSETDRNFVDEYYLSGVDRRTYGYYGYSSTGAGLAYEGSDRYWTNQFDITRSLKGDLTSQVTTHHQVKAGAQYNALLLDMNDIQFPWSSDPSFTRYTKHPWEFGAYLQDKVEYDFMILNVGVRYDASAAGPVKYWIDPRIPVHPDTSMSDEDRLIILPREYDNPPVTTGRTNTSLAPRFGISHPVTDQAVLYFNYGQFFQKPIYRNVYRINRIDRGNPITGNPNLENEKTIQYEFGYKHQFTDIYALELTMWAKDTSNLVATERVPAWFQGTVNPYEYTVSLNYDYSNSKGFDLVLQRRYSNLWSARVNYSYMEAYANRDDPWQGYRDGDNGTLEQSPKRTRKVGWDVPHRFSSSISIQLPRGSGPEVAGVRPFENVSASLIFRANAGRPYTPVNIDGYNLEVNSERRPWTFQWDLRLYRDFNMFGLRYSIFADVRNLLDRKNVSSVFTRTGKPDDPGPDATSSSDNYDRFHYYGTPRRINVGLRIYF